MLGLRAFHFTQTCAQASAWARFISNVKPNRTNQFMRLEEVVNSIGESASVEFKSAIDPTNLQDKLEITKDIVALANSGGGSIVVGVEDDGSPSGADVSKLVSFDPANLTNLINQYTGIQFANFTISSRLKGNSTVCIISVEPVRVPIVFTRVGEYEIPETKKKKTAFALGSVYFRHGAKSEPGNTDDLRSFLERELNSIRRSWLENIAQVVEAPIGTSLRLVVDNPSLSGEAANQVHLTNDVNAPTMHLPNLNETHPFRGKEVLSQVNNVFHNSGVRILTHDLVCIRRVHAVARDPNMVIALNGGFTRYTKAFVAWLLSEFAKDGDFFFKTRDRERMLRPKD
jgi:hypothetical protein